MYGKKSKLVPNVDGAIAKLDATKGVGPLKGNVIDVEVAVAVPGVGAGGGAVR